MNFKKFEKLFFNLSTVNKFYQISLSWPEIYINVDVDAFCLVEEQKRYIILKYRWHESKRAKDKKNLRQHETMQWCPIFFIYVL